MAEHYLCSAPGCHGWHLPGNRQTRFTGLPNPISPLWLSAQLAGTTPAAHSGRDTYRQRIYLWHPAPVAGARHEPPPGLHRATGGPGRRDPARNGDYPPAGYHPLTALWQHLWRANG